jgi:hypothetical protein
MQEFSRILHDEFTQYKYHVHTGILSSFPVKLLRIFDSDKAVKKQLFGYGNTFTISNAKIKKLLSDLRFRALDESLIEMGYDLIGKGIIMESGAKDKHSETQNNFHDS